MTNGPVVVIIPTYNEYENVPLIVERVRTAVPVADVLVVDDNSPDGTGETAEKLAATDPAVHVLHRAGKDGLGAAYLTGFAWALERRYGVVVQMDADGSHSPEQLPSLLARIEDGADVAMGSRWIRGGRVVNWPVWRRLLSQVGNGYARHALGMPLHDVTGGFRAIRTSALVALDLDTIASQGYCIQIDLAYRGVQLGHRMEELPITFVERELGASKMNRSIMVESFRRVTVWAWHHRLAQVRSGLRPART